MSTHPPLHIFRAGAHIAATGEAASFSEADLAATAAAYDPTKHEAPIVIGHPTHDAPAYGWIQALSASGAELLGTPYQVDAQFAEWVKSGRVKKISSSFYRPDAKANPVPGVYYLRHVGFLGAQPPAVKGLRAPEFADSEEDCVTLEFDEADANLFALVGEIFQRLRDWIITQSDQATADNLIPTYLVDLLKQAPLAEALQATTEDQSSMTTPDTQFAEREQQLTEREQRIKEHEQRLQEGMRKVRRDAAIAFVETITQPPVVRVPPKFKAGLVEFLCGLDPESSLSFSDGTETRQENAEEWFHTFLKSLPPMVEFRELSAGAGSADTAIGLTDGEIARRAQRYHGRMRDAGTPVNFTQSVDAVKSGRDI